jgi:transporter family-2 protein
MGINCQLSGYTISHSLSDGSSQNRLIPFTLGIWLKEERERRYRINMVGIFIALISGALMSVQGVFNTQVTKSSSIWTASTFVQFSALLVCLGAWLFTDRSPLLNVLKADPKYMLLGGVIGAFITYTVIKGMEILGPARAVMLIVVSQLLVAYVIELFGWFGTEKQPWEWRKAIGMAAAIVGIIIFKWE